MANPPVVPTAIIGILTAISPLIVSLISKHYENRSDRIKARNRLEDAQIRLKFWSDYFELQSKLIADAALAQIKENVSSQLIALQAILDGPLEKKEEKAGGRRVSLRQSGFLIFRPLSWQGWILVILFYFDLAFVSTALMGMILNLVNHEWKDLGYGIAGLLFFIAILLGLRYLALLKHKKDIALAGKP